MKQLHFSTKLVWLCAFCSVWAASVAAQSPAAATPCRTPSVVTRVAFTSLAFALTKAPRVFASPWPCQQQAAPTPTPSPTPPAVAKPAQRPEPKPDALTEAMPTESRLAEFPAAEVMRLARMLYIRQRSAWFNAEKLERELQRKNKIE